MAGVDGVWEGFGRKMCKIHRVGVPIDKQKMTRIYAMDYLFDAHVRCNYIGTDITMGGFPCQHLVRIIFVLRYSSYFFFQLAGLDPSKSFDIGVGVTACGVFGKFLS